MQRYYSNLIILESDQKEGIFCKGKGWQISFEPNSSSNVITAGEPAKEIVVYTQTADRAQYVVDMVLAAYCLYTGEPLTFDQVPVFPKRAQTIGEAEKQIMAGGGHSIGVYNLPLHASLQPKLLRGMYPSTESSSTF